MEQASTLGTEGDLMLVDLQRYLLSTRGNLRVDSSIHVPFVYDEMAIRFIYRVDGQPDFATAKTPYKGTDTQSPFVTLATRA